MPRRARAAAGERGQAWCLALLAAAACAPPAPPLVTPRPSKSAPTETVVLCGSTVVERDEYRCTWPLTPEQQRRRPSTTRLLLHGAELLRVDTVSGSGAPRELSLVYERRAGRITGWSWEDPNGVLRGRDVLADDGRWVRWWDEQDRPRARAGTNVSGLRRTLDERGRVTSQGWVSSLGAPTLDGGVQEIRSTYDERGAVVQRRFYGERGEPVNDASGAQRVEVTVDARGLELSRRYFEATGRAASVEGVHEARSSFDAFGVVATTSYFDAQGRPTRDTRYGAAQLRFERDERGNERSLTLGDEQGLPMLGAGGWARRQRRYDALDAVVETSFFDLQGRPARDRERGVAVLRQLRDSRGNVVTELSFDELGEPTLGAAGYHRVEIEYDQRDNPTSYVYSDASGAPLRSRRLLYDGDRLIREEHRDPEGKPLLTAQGYASYEISYRDDGSEGIKRYFDAQGGMKVSCQGNASSALQSELAERAGSLRACYERLLRYGSTEEGRLLVELAIDARGQVLKAELVQDEIGDGDLSKCVLETMRVPYLNPAEGDCATVRVPVTFRQKR